MPLRRLSAAVRERLLLVWVVVFTALTFYALHEGRERSVQNRALAEQGRTLAVQGRDLARANRDRVTDLQNARLASCKQTYEGVREVFRPFFPPKKDRTQKQKDDLKTFNDTIDDLKANCRKQTDT